MDRQTKIARLVKITGWTGMRWEHMHQLAVMPERLESLVPRCAIDMVASWRTALEEGREYPALVVVLDDEVSEDELDRCPQVAAHCELPDAGEALGWCL